MVPVEDEVLGGADPGLPERRVHRIKRRRRLQWLLVPVGLIGVALIAVAVMAFCIKLDYEKRAAAFDLSKVREMESASVILDRHEKVLGSVYIQNRLTVPLSDMPVSMIEAVVAAEDARFFQHRGIDVVRILGAALRNYRAQRIRQGGSTITQQLARNTYGLVERSYDRKMIEIFLAAHIERHFTKNEIMELYLNRIYFGGGFYGVEAAARGYFGKTAKRLSVSECAMLAGLIKSPNRLSPWTDRQASVRERDRVLDRMLELNRIDKKTHDQAIAEELAVKSRTVFQAGTESYALDYIRQLVIEQVGLENATSEGYKVYTTIDGELQRVAEDGLKKQLAKVEHTASYTHQTGEQYAEILRRYAAEQKAAGEGNGDEAAAPPIPKYLQGAVFALDNADGGIVVLVGGRDFRQSQFNRAVQAARPAGTGFLPIVYAAAFSNGIFPGRLFDDSAIDNRQVMIGGTTGILGEWGPERIDNRYEGAMPAHFALVKSKNAASVRVGMAVGFDSLQDLARRAGIKANLRRFPATYLGSSEVTLQDMTLAYSTFPNLGWRPSEPYIIRRIEARDGTILSRHQPNRVQVMDEAIAYQVHTCLADVLEWGTGDRSHSQYGLKRFPAGGKTGTAYDFTDVWFLGYSSALTCGVWVGFDLPRSIYRGAFSNEIALPIWVDVMNASTQSHPPREIRQPVGLRKVEVDLASGLLASDKSSERYQDPLTGRWMQRRNTYFELATEQQMPKEYYDGRATTGAKLAGAPLAPGEWPRAAVAVDLSSIPAIEMKEPAVVGEDPYGAVAGATATREAVEAVAEVGQAVKEVRRAAPVRPFDDPREQSAKPKIQPLPPMVFR